MKDVLSAAQDAIGEVLLGKSQAIKLARELPSDQLVLCNLSGRGDKDIHTVAELDGISI